MKLAAGPASTIAMRRPTGCRSKARDRSAALTHFVSGPTALGEDPASLPAFVFSLGRNGTVVTNGNTEKLEFDILTHVWEMHKVGSLRPGDVIMSGTPFIGECQVGDVLNLKCDQLGIDYTVSVCDEEDYVKAMSKI